MFTINCAIGTVQYVLVPLDNTGKAGKRGKKATNKYKKVNLTSIIKRKNPYFYDLNILQDITEILI